MRRWIPALFLILSCVPARAEEIVFTPADRVLVVAPHPDDESIGAGGVIQAARAAGAAVRVLFVTHGDDNEIASLFYLKRPLVRKGDFIKSGLTRRAEALAAATKLGVGPGEIAFFGYPDRGLYPIWRDRWGSVKPFRSFVTRINRVPYKEDLSYGKEHRGENVAADFRQAIGDFAPTQVFVTAPYDRNSDHQATYLFTRLALLDLEGALAAAPKLRLYVVHARLWPRPRAYEPSRPLPPPKALSGRPSIEFPLSEGFIAKKREAVSCYRSQLSYAKKFLYSFVRKNELFFTPEDAALERRASGGEPVEAPEPKSGIETAFAQQDGELWISARFGDSLDELGAFDLKVFPYKKGAFAAMPKFRFRLFGKKFFVYRGGRRLSDPRIRYSLEQGRLTVRLPLDLLGGPEALFVSAETAKEGSAPGGWRLLRV